MVGSSFFRFFFLSIFFTALGLFPLQPAGAEQDRGEHRVCFCHNLEHNPHTICTANEGLINGHLHHVGEGLDLQGSCEEHCDDERICCRPEENEGPYEVIVLYDGNREEGGGDERDACRSCGDGICKEEESCENCSEDCGSCDGPSCGDGVCNGEETCGSCNEDCGPCFESTCGDDVCNEEESCESCAEDCGSCEGSFCGNGACEGEESCGNCPQDCGSCSSNADPSPDPNPQVQDREVTDTNGEAVVAELFPDLEGSGGCSLNPQNSTRFFAWVFAMLGALPVLIFNLFLSKPLWRRPAWGSSPSLSDK